MLYRTVAALLVLVVPALASADESGPQARTPTDPQSIRSESKREARQPPLEDLFYSRSVSGGTWSPDGREVAFTTNLTGRANLWKVAAGGGWPLQLAPSNERQEAARWSPDGKWIAYQQDEGGNELWDVYIVPAEGGAPINLTHTADVREESPLWSPDGKTLLINIKPKSGTSYDLALLDLATRQVRRLTNEKAADHLWNGTGFSPDGRTVYATRAEISFNDSD
ncbi:MAG: PD40 domain-containing protein, partial [Gammaproteobacteria bacterium]|nr:PD40 domain-containing protein [Gammaproteobacteria bacterium]